MTRYTTRDEAIYHEITAPLGDDVTDFDVDAIADELIEFRVDHDDQGRELLDTAGYEVREDVEFWAVVERHETR